MPSGRQVRLTYEAGRPPILAVRLQELFGWSETPRVARGRVPVCCTYSDRTIGRSRSPTTCAASGRPRTTRSEKTFAAVIPNTPGPKTRFRLAIRPAHTHSGPKLS